MASAGPARKPESRSEGDTPPESQVAPFVVAPLDLQAAKTPALTALVRAVEQDKDKPKATAFLTPDNQESLCQRLARTLPAFPWTMQDMDEDLSPVEVYLEQCMRAQAVTPHGTIQVKVRDGGTSWRASVGTNKGTKAHGHSSTAPEFAVEKLLVEVTKAGSMIALCQEESVWEKLGDAHWVVFIICVALGVTLLALSFSTEPREWTSAARIGFRLGAGVSVGVLGLFYNGLAKEHRVTCRTRAESRKYRLKLMIAEMMRLPVPPKDSERTGADTSQAGNLALVESPRS